MTTTDLTIDQLAAKVEELRGENARLMQRESEAVMQATRDAARADANAAQCGRLAALLSEYLTYDCPAHMAPAAGSLPHRARLALRDSMPTSAQEQLKSALWNYREQHGKPALKEFLGGYLQLPR